MNIMNCEQLSNTKIFDVRLVDPETLEFNQKLEKLLSAQPPVHTLTPQQVRQGRESGNGFMGHIKRRKEGLDRVVLSGTKDIPIRIFIPDEVQGVYLHMHGGGFVTGHPHYFDELLFHTAVRTNLAVVSVDYRLAPEHPYPAAANDCEAVALWLLENAQKEFGSENFLIGGESAGANLAVVTLIRMRDRHGFSGFSKANLVFGCFDISMTPSQRNWGERNLIVSTPTIEWYNLHYMPDPTKRRNPDVSPLYAQLEGLPEALFTVGTWDPLLDDSLFMHARWAAAGNQSELAVYPGGMHAFTMFPISLARSANQKIYAFLKN